MKLKSGMFLEPCLHLFSMVNAHIVANDMDEGDGIGSVPVDLFKKGNEFLLPFAAETLSDDISGSGVECGKEV